MTKHGIDLNSEPIRAFCRKWKINELSVFGSIVRDDFRPDSDVDFVVDFEKGADWDLADLADIRIGLSKILNREVDLLTKGALRQTENWLFRKIVLAELETVYAQG
jgi:uncharacterized protein